MRGVPGGEDVKGGAVFLLEAGQAMSLADLVQQAPPNKVQGYRVKRDQNSPVILHPLRFEGRPSVILNSQGIAKNQTKFLPDLGKGIEIGYIRVAMAIVILIGIMNGPIEVLQRTAQARQVMVFEEAKIDLSGGQTGEDATQKAPDGAIFDQIGVVAHAGSIGSETAHPSLLPVQRKSCFFELAAAAVPEDDPPLLHARCSQALGQNGDPRRGRRKESARDGIDLDSHGIAGREKRSPGLLRGSSSCQIQEGRTHHGG